MWPQNVPVNGVVSPKTLSHHGLSGHNFEATIKRMVLMLDHLAGGDQSPLGQGLPESSSPTIFTTSGH